MADPKFYDDVWDRTATTGTGTVTLSGTSPTGYRTFTSTLTDGDLVYYRIFDLATGAWEVGLGTYTASGTTLARTVFLSSSTGSAVSFAAGQKEVIVVAPAELFSSLMAMTHLNSPGGRLTLTSGTPVDTSDVTSAGTIYYTPYVSDQITLWDGKVWRGYSYTEKSIALTATSGKNYDVWCYVSSGTPTLETLVWTDDTTRATAITLQDGRYCKSGDKTRLYLGTFRANGSNITESSKAKRFLWNMYNQVPFKLERVEATNSTWTYSTATIRQARADAANQVEFVLGLPQALVNMLLIYFVTNSVTASCPFGIGLDSTTVFTSVCDLVPSAGAYANGTAVYADAPGVGYHTLTWLEKGAGSGTTTWHGYNSGFWQNGLRGSLLA